MLCTQCGNEVNCTDYVGKLVFVEAHRGTLTEKEYSNYDGGEYLVIRQSPNLLYGVKIGSADEYNGRQVKQLALVGERRFNVLSVSCPKRSEVEFFVRELWHNAHKRERGEKLNWVESVYGEAKTTARQLASILNISLPEIVCAAPYDAGQRLDKLESDVRSLKDKLKSLATSL